MNKKLLKYPLGFPFPSAHQGISNAKMLAVDRQT